LIERVGVSRPVQLLASSLVEVPTVVGWFRPVVLMPVAALTGLPPSHVEALLAHELAHVRRLDYLLNLLQAIAETVLFYHPAVWWVSEQIRAEREICCDDLAIAASGDVLNYVRALAELESFRLPRSSQMLTANGGSLLNRIRRLIGQTPSLHDLPGPGPVVVMSLLCIFGIGAMAANGSPRKVLPHPLIDVRQRPISAMSTLKPGSVASMLLFGPLGPAPATQPSATEVQGPTMQGVATVQGTVVRSGSGEPVARARVTLSLDGKGGAPILGSTDDRGQFLFQDVPTGRYRMSVTRDGFLQAEYGQRANGHPGATFTLADRQELKDILIPLNPAGTIAGKIVDRYGEPVANANVQALKYGYDLGHRVLIQVNSARTDELGAFRLFWMQAGEYVVRATATDNAATGAAVAADLATVAARRAGASPTITNVPPIAVATLPETHESQVPIYYPGTPDVTAATAVNLRPGEVVGGVNFTMSSIHAVHIRGVLLNGTTGQASSGTSVSLMVGSTLGTLIAPLRNAIASNNGMFEFRDVPPGSYVLSTSGGTGKVTVLTIVDGNVPALQQLPPAAPAANVPLFARTSIDVAASDIDNVILTMRPGVSIPGRVMVDGATSGLNSVANLSVQLQSDTVSGIRQPAVPPSSVDGNGVFTLTGIGPGDYRINLTGTPANMYLKAARLGSTDVLTTGLHIDFELVGQLDISLGSNPASLDVTVLDEKQKPLFGETVALVPDQSRRQRIDVYKYALSDEKGHVHFDGIVPGDYKLFAWDDVEAGAWMNPDFIKAYEDNGRSVHLLENEKQTVDNLRPTR
jgi:hypothetical protein